MITLSQANHTSSYYDALYAPTKAIYCHSQNAPYGDLTHSWVSGRAYCFVRIGNTLAYPVVSSYGWSYSGFNYPSRCTAGSVSDIKAAEYYCNLMDVVFGFVYYPVPNLNPNHTYTFAPTRLPTQMPTPGAGQPSRNPTHVPTYRPTVRPTARPTPLPGYPTLKPSYTATLRPTTFRPTPVAGSPTFLPTFTPTKDPSWSANPTTSFRPTYSAKPTAPTCSPTTRSPTVARRLSEKELEFLDNNRLYFNRKLVATDAPSETPTYVPTDAPTLAPNDVPTELPTEALTDAPTDGVSNNYNVNSNYYYGNNYFFYNFYNYYFNYYGFYGYGPGESLSFDWHSVCLIALCT